MITKILRVGDPHVTVDALSDCQALLNLVLETAIEHKVKRIDFLGDQYNNHALMHIEVMAFWQRNFKKLRHAGFEVLALVGNHDMPGDGSCNTAMMAHPNITVIDTPTVLDGILYVPYMASEKEFVEACKVESQVVVAHQSFFGAMYENGFPCEDGFNPSLLHQGLIISGHIHRPQELVGTAVDGSYQKVWYLGAPRWRTVSDANTVRNIWVMTHDEKGFLYDTVAIPTGKVCCQIIHLEDTPAVPLILDPSPNTSYTVDIKGPLAFIEQRKALWSGIGRVRTFNTDTIVIKVKESEGISVAWDKYLDVFKAPMGTPASVLRKLATERLHVNA